MSTKSNTYTDHQLVSLIKTGGPDRFKAIDHIYAWSDLKNKIMYHVTKNGGNREDANDVFHDSIIILDRNIRQDKYKSEGSIAAYLYSICKFTWNNKWRKNIKTELVEDFSQETPEESNSVHVHLINEETKLNLEKLLSKLDDSCRSILKMWQLSYSMQEIAEAQNLSSPQMAKKYRYRCMKKLMKVLDDNPELLNALRNV